MGRGLAIFVKVTRCAGHLPVVSWPHVCPFSSVQQLGSQDQPDPGPPGSCRAVWLGAQQVLRRLQEGSRPRSRLRQRAGEGGGSRSPWAAGVALGRLSRESRLVARGAVADGSRLQPTP